MIGVQKVTQHIGEIVVLGPSFALQKRFLTHLCNEVILIKDDAAFGRRRISDELQLFFYALGEKEQYGGFAWDIVGRKILGWVVLFNWFDGNAFLETQRLTDSLVNRLDSLGVIAGDIAEAYLPVPQPLQEYGFSLSPRLHFALWNSAVKSAASNIMRILIDSAIHATE